MLYSNVAVKVMAPNATSSHDPKNATTCFAYGRVQALLWFTLTWTLRPPTVCFSTLEKATSSSTYAIPFNNNKTRIFSLVTLSTSFNAQIK